MQRGSGTQRQEREQHSADHRLGNQTAEQDLPRPRSMHSLCERDEEDDRCTDRSITRSSDRQPRSGFFGGAGTGTAILGVDFHIPPSVHAPHAHLSQPSSAAASHIAQTSIAPR
jgi:hypothetical protein